MADSLLVIESNNDSYNVSVGTMFTPVQDLFLDEVRLKTVLDYISKEVKSLVPDISTAKGRAEIKSLAAKVASSKVLLDNLGKDAVAELKKKPAMIDAARKTAREFLDTLKEEVRQPLTDWENAKELQKKKAAEAAQYLVDWDLAITMNSVFDAKKELAETKAAAAKVEAEAQEKVRIANIEKEAAIAATRTAERAVRDISPQTPAKMEAEAATNLAVNADQICVKNFTEYQPVTDTGKTIEITVERKAKVNRDVQAALVLFGLTEEVATKLVIAIVRGMVMNVKIEY